MVEPSDTATKRLVFDLLENVKDPEIPALSVLDMAIVRDVEVRSKGVCVTITPTYSGCPAMKMIEGEIVSQLKKGGFEQVDIKTVLSPAWTSDWLSEEAKAKLKKSGIAPPCVAAESDLVVFPSKKMALPACPYCDSAKVKLESEFGTTACKALYVCKSCGQPFDYFKSI